MNNEPYTSWPSTIRSIYVYSGGKRVELQPNVYRHDNGLDCVVQLCGGNMRAKVCVDFTVRSSIGLAWALTLAEEEARRQVKAKEDARA